MWDAFVAWIQSPSGQRVLDTAVIPALAILVAGVLAAWIARSAIRSLLRRADREAVAGAVAALVEVARVLGAGAARGPEADRVARLRAEGDVRLRLSGVRGAAIAAEWASLRLDAIDRDAASPVPQTTAAVDELRDRLLAWTGRPRRAKRLFAADVERLGAERTARRAVPGETAAPEAADDRAPAEQPLTDLGTPQTSPTGNAPVPAATAASIAADDRRPEPVAARAQNLAHELQADRAKAERESAAEATPTAASGSSPVGSDNGPRPITEPVLIQRTRLDLMDRESEDARADHARHARPADRAPAGAALPPESRFVPERAESGPAPAVAYTPPAEPQPTPAWLDTYDDEAAVTRDIDLSKTPPPKSAATVRDRTHTGDDIVPRH